MILEKIGSILVFLCLCGPLFFKKEPWFSDNVNINAHLEIIELTEKKSYKHLTYFFNGRFCAENISFHQKKIENTCWRSLTKEFVILSNFPFCTIIWYLVEILTPFSNNSVNPRALFNTLSLIEIFYCTHKSWFALKNKE